MNRQTKQLLALAGVLAVGLGAYAALRVWNAGEEEREAAQADYVLQLSDVTALSFDSGDGPLSFTLEETGWTWDGDSEFPVNGTELDALREDLAALKAERIIPEPDALADYGLERENMYDASVIRSAGATCEEMAVLCFDSEEQASKAVEALEDYVAGQITANEDYRPAEIPKLENALVKQLQHTVLLLVANDYEAAAIDAYHSKS